MQQQDAFAATRRMLNAQCGCELDSVLKVLSRRPTYPPTRISQPTADANAGMSPLGRKSHDYAPSSTGDLSLGFNCTHASIHQFDVYTALIATGGNWPSRRVECQLNL